MANKSKCFTQIAYKRYALFLLCTLSAVTKADDAKKPTYTSSARLKDGTKISQVPEEISKDHVDVFNRCMGTACDAFPDNRYIEPIFTNPKMKFSGPSYKDKDGRSFQGQFLQNGKVVDGVPKSGPFVGIAKYEDSPHLELKYPSGMTVEEAQRHGKGHYHFKISHQGSVKRPNDNLSIFTDPDGSGGKVIAEDTQGSIIETNVTAIHAVRSQLIRQ